MSAAARARAGFAAAFGREPEGLVRAPGRVNLIGEHTDYNDGFVLPCALQFATWVAYGARDDGQVRVIACDLAAARDTFRASSPEPVAAGDWRNYVRGTIALLGLTSPGGADLAIAGDIPRGCGLSSSAALEVAVGLAMATVSGMALSPTELAQAGQRAEHAFAGVQCGIMDQLVSAGAVAGSALMIDCRSYACRPVAVPAEVAILLVESGVQRGLVDGHYNARRRECAAAAAALGVTALRGATLPDLERVSTRLPPPVVARARHVITENARVGTFAAALAGRDWDAMGALMAASHRSMRDDFAITVPGVDRLVELLVAAIQDVAGGRGGARMTGGGFGGAVVAVVPADRADAVADRISTVHDHLPMRIVPAAGASVEALV
jgi:galactokinase